MKNPGVLFNGYDGDFRLAVALGKVPGWSTFRKFGHNSAVGIGTEEMWSIGTAKVLPTVAAVTSSVSSSDSDGVGGTGAQIIVIEGIGEDKTDAVDTITMNGTAPVAGTVKFYRINRVYNATGGTNRVNVGNITVSVGGAAQAYIEAGDGQTQQTGYTIPAGKTLLINSIMIGIGRMANGDCHISTMMRAPGSTTMWRSQSDIYIYNSGYEHHNDHQIILVPEQYDIKQVIITSAATQAHSIYGGFLIENKYLHDD